MSKLFLVVLLVLPSLASAQPWDVTDTERPGQWTIYGGIENGALLGMPLAAGDFDGDGDDDVIVTPMNASISGESSRDRAGVAFILLSPGTVAGETDIATRLPPALPPDTVAIYGADDQDYLGTEVWAADFDGDGIDDVIIGAQRGAGPANTRAGAGETYIIWGFSGIGGSLIDLALATGSDAVTVIYGAREGDRLGVWVSSGDFDGDGSVDALIGADQSDGAGGDRSHVGASYVIYGGCALRQRRSIDLATTSAPFTVVYGIDEEDHSGCTVRSFDLDDDGADDLLIGAGLNRLSATVAGHSTAGGDGPGNNVPIAGEAYAVYGAVGQRPAQIDLRSPPESTVIIFGIDQGDAYGEEIFGGDFNGDGQGDIAVGALTGDGPDNIRPNAGELALILGSPSLPGSRIRLAESPPGVTIIYGAGSPGIPNDSASIAGDTAVLLDLNGDGRDDLALASPQEAAGSRRRAGVVDVIFGTDAPLPAEIDLAQPPAMVQPFRILGAEQSDMLAYSMALGDIDADGLQDLVFNAMAGDGLDNAVGTSGDAYVLAAPSISEAAGRTVTFPTDTPTGGQTPTPPRISECFGDCNEDGAVLADDLMIAIGVALAERSITDCPEADADGDNQIVVSELVLIVDSVLDFDGSAAAYGAVRSKE